MTVVSVLDGYSKVENTDDLDEAIKQITDDAFKLDIVIEVLGVLYTVGVQEVYVGNEKSAVVLKPVGLYERK